MKDLQHIRDAAIEEYEQLTYLERRPHPHPNIVTLLELEDTPTMVRIFMEYCEQGSLLDYFENRPLGTLLPVHDLVSIMFQINNGLFFCHDGAVCDGYPGDGALRAGKWGRLGDPPLLHRDLKPANSKSISLRLLRHADGKASSYCQKSKNLTILGQIGGLWSFHRC
jgi:serine/threonine protein kinase